MALAGVLQVTLRLCPQPLLSLLFTWLTRLLVHRTVRVEFLLHSKRALSSEDRKVEKIVQALREFLWEATQANGVTQWKAKDFY